MTTPSESSHDVLVEQLPLLVGGAMAHKDEAHLRTHVASCRSCEEELAALSAAREHAAAQYERFARASPQASLARVLARIDADRRATGRQGLAQQTWQRRIAQWWNSWPNGARWLAATQAASVAALAVLTLIAWPAREATFFEPASAPSAATAGHLTVAFADAARAVDIASLLGEIDATIVAGPTAAGFYTLRLTPRSPPDALARLRVRGELVRYAELTPGPN